MKGFGAFFITFIFLIVFLPANGQTVFPSETLLNASRREISAGNFETALMLADSVYNHTNNRLTRLQAAELKAKAHKSLGHLVNAEINYKEVADGFRDLTKNNLTNPNFLNALFNYAQFLVQTGNYSDCLALTEGLGDNVAADLAADIMGLRASAFIYSDSLRAALNLLDGAIGKIHLSQDRPDTSSQILATLYQNRGFAKDKLKDYQGAIKDYETALPSLEGKKKGTATANLAMTLAKSGNEQQALQKIDEALRILAPFGETDEDYVVAKRKKAEILFMARKYKESALEMESFFNLEKKRLKAILPTLYPQMRLDYWTKEKPLLSKIFILGKERPDLAFDAALVRRQISLAGSSAHLASFPEKDLTHKDIASRLGKDEAAVAFVLYPDENDVLQNAAITLDNKGKVSFVSLFPQDYIYSRNKGNNLSLNEAVTENDPIYKNYLYTDTLLANNLWGPILEKLPENVRTIHFAPEGIFHLWGIENLPFTGFDNYTIIRHFSLNDINRSEKKKNKRGKILVAGGLDYDTLPSDSTSQNISGIPNSDAYMQILRATSAENGSQIFQYLPGTEKEVLMIGRTIDNSDLRLELTEEEYKNLKDRYSTIHLATHGYALNSDIQTQGRAETDSLGFDMTLWHSGIALSGANVASSQARKDDGILSAREICDLDLSDTSLVVLSACETARGVITDESASGLIRALKNAGADTIVASLWEIDDESACFFMTEFHRGIASGLSKYEAFLNAREKTKNLNRKLSLRRYKSGTMASRPSGESVTVTPYSDPWFWAPFIIIDP